MPLIPWDNMRVKHTWSAVPANWETLGSPSAGTMIDLYIALNPHQEDTLNDALYKVSDPRHLRHVHLTAAPLAPSFTYGAHLSKDQVAELVRPHPDTLELVTPYVAASVPSPGVPDRAVASSEMEEMRNEKNDSPHAPGKRVFSSSSIDSDGNAVSADFWQA
ncbi:hypothetical protein EDB86DRAFT_2833056 [Lactarius hatsudake]|nr:hypothetical protein EDB86DRAFT_2833056 [Lactarius hatsudake]